MFNFSKNINSFFRSLSYDLVVFSERFLTCDTNTRYSFMSLRIGEVFFINYFDNFFSKTSLMYSIKVVSSSPRYFVLS